jgi:hypothetical protein
MRQLTASEKIAILENRVAQLEKQAFIVMFHKQLSAFARVKPKVAEVIKSTGKTPEQIAKGFVKDEKNPQLVRVLKKVKREAGSNPLKQVAFVLRETEKSKFQKRGFAEPEFVSSFLLMLSALGITAAIGACYLIVHIVKDYLKSFFSRSASSAFGLVLKIIRFFLDLKVKILRYENEAEDFED